MFTSESTTYWLKCSLLLAVYFQITLAYLNSTQTYNNANHTNQIEVSPNKNTKQNLKEENYKDFKTSELESRIENGSRKEKLTKLETEEHEENEEEDNSDEEKEKEDNKQCGKHYALCEPVLEGDNCCDGLVCLSTPFARVCMYSVQKKWDMK